MRRAIGSKCNVAALHYLRVGQLPTRRRASMRCLRCWARPLSFPWRTPPAILTSNPRQKFLHAAPQKRVRTIVSADVEIHSLKNQRVKDTRALLRRRQREKDGRIILEGQRLIADALDAGLRPREFFYTDEALQRSERHYQLRETAVDRGAEDLLVSDGVIKSLTDTVNPQGLVGVFDRPNLQLPRRPTLTLICDEIRDPGNLGTLLRSAAGAGVEAVALTPGCADVWSLKVLRSGMGAQFRLPVQTKMTWPDIVTYLEEPQSRILVAEGGASVEYTSVDWRAPSAIVIGSEAEGPSASAFGAAHDIIAIPLCGGVESLNASVAGAIILFEAKRQREGQGLPSSPID